jgi:hypothetical protein
MISREQAEKYHPHARLPALEQSPADDGHLIGRDPRRISIAELTGLGHQARPLLAVIRAKCLDCVGYERSEVRKCTAIDCALWPYRMLRNPFRTVSQGQREQGRRLAAARDAGISPSECPANSETPETGEEKMAYAHAHELGPPHLPASKKHTPLLTPSPPGAARVVTPNSRRHARGRAFAPQHASNALDAPGDGRRKTSRNFRAATHKIASRRSRPEFPRTVRRASVGCGAELAFEFFEDRGAVALAASCAVETAIEVRLDADRQQDTHHLHLHRAAQRVEFSDRPHDRIS